MTSIILGEKEMSRAISRIAHEIVEKNKGTQNLVLMGIRTRGVFLAKRLQKKIATLEGETVPLGILDITLYRDDLGVSKQNPIIKKTEIYFSVEKKKIILCDDVLFTGRTIRAAIDATMDFGRPAVVQLAVLIDRGHRELPIRPDYVGKNIPTSKEMRIQVNMIEEDKNDSVTILEFQG